MFTSSVYLLVLCVVTKSADQVLQPFYNASDNPCHKSKSVNLLVMAPFTGLDPGTKSGPIVLPASILAANLINERCDILEDYRIELVVADSGCQIITRAISSLVNVTFDKHHQVVGIVGPSCSVTAIEVGAFLAHPDIDLLHISPSATTPMLLNVAKFPNTFRPLSSSLGFITMYLALINELQIRRVAIFFEHGSSVQASAAQEFQRVILRSHEDVSVMLLGMSNFLFPLEQIRSRYRLVFVFGGREISRKLLCLAYRKNMIYPEYQFFFSEIEIQDIRGSIRDNVTVNFNGATFRCTGGSGDMTNATVGTMLSVFEQIREDTNTPIVDNRTTAKFFGDYERLLYEYLEQIGLSSIIGRRALNELNSHQSGYYDSVWALALALNASIPRLENELNMSLDDYTYGHANITEIVRSELLKVGFEGTRGRVEFSEKTHDGESVTRIRVTNIVSSDKREIVWQFDPSLPQEGQINISNPSLFVPDSFDQIIIAPPVYVEVTVLIVVALLAIILVLFHVVNLKWTGVQSIKVTSPLLNNLIFSGCYIYLISIFFLSFKLVTGSKNHLLFAVKCSGFIWCESLAFSLIFGTICLKTWRILRIFSTSSAKVVSHLDNHFLVLYICLIALFDVVYNVLWNVIDPWFMRSKEDERQVRITCDCNDLTIWVSILLGQKAILTIAVLYTSIATRQVQRKEYKQTKSTNVLVYIFVLLNSLLFPVYVLLLNSESVLFVTVSYLALCLKNILCVVMCIILVFLPPIFPILKERWKTVT